VKPRSRLSYLRYAAFLLAPAAALLWSAAGCEGAEGLLTQVRLVPPREPPAFYSGSLYDAMATRDYSPAELFGPSAARSHSGKLYPVGTYPNAEKCGACHASIHDNWKRTLHARAAIDPWYLKTRELFAAENPRGELALRSCAGCHAPVALMQGEVGLYNKEAESSLEGVGCSFCHTVEDTTGPNGGYVSHPERPRRYRGGGDPLFSGRPGLARRLLMAFPAAHKSDLRPEWMKGLEASKLCRSCHDQVVNGVYVQSVYQEWLASDYARRGVSCQDCHFTPGPAPEEVSGRIVNGYGRKRNIKPHVLTGASTHVGPGSGENVGALRAALGMEVERKGATLTVWVENKHAGHSVPAGAGDLRQLWLEVIGWDAQGNVVFSSGKLDRAGYLDRGAAVFHQVIVDEDGNPLRRHDVWRAASIEEDTRLSPHEKRPLRYDLPVSAATVRVRLLWRDAHADFVSGVLKKDPLSVPVVELKRWSSNGTRVIR